MCQTSTHTGPILGTLWLFALSLLSCARSREKRLLETKGSYPADPKSMSACMDGAENFLSRFKPHFAPFYQRPPQK
ncbi:hypothetical protein BJ741DRAFT_598569 [Chytriomyces cf. hyalinus JEL632]|nr:hypothetical protein BJ741DRAFT_598569 [Chytriomyces cf. hyalinus JEL632]